jgi:hypothetical protein
MGGEYGAMGGDYGAYGGEYGTFDATVPPPLTELEGAPDGVQSLFAQAEAGVITYEEAYETAEEDFEWTSEAHDEAGEYGDGEYGGGEYGAMGGEYGAMGGEYGGDEDDEEDEDEDWDEDEGDEGDEEDEEDEDKEQVA